MGFFSKLIEDGKSAANLAKDAILKVAKVVTDAIKNAIRSATDAITKSAALMADLIFQEKIASANDAEDSAQQKKVARKRQKKMHEWRDVKEPIKFVNQHGKVFCPFCSIPIGDFKVTSTQVSLQDTFQVTAGDRMGAPAPNLVFKGQCLYPTWRIPPPCMGVIQPGIWKDTSQTYIDNNHALLRKSTIPCMVSQQDIQIVHSGQKAWLDQLKPQKEPEVKRIKVDLKELDEGSANDGSNGTQFGMIYGKKYHFEVTEFCENLEPKNENTIKWEYSYVNSDGEVVIGAIQKRGRKMVFEIDDLKMLGTTITIRAYINNHLRSQKEEVWVHNRFRWFDKSIFKKQLELRLNSPEKFDQHNTSLCGTVAILYITAKDAMYKSKMKDSFIEFFRTGYCMLNDFLLNPNSSLFEMKPNESNKKYPHYDKYSNGVPIIPPNLMEQADWITLASTRSSDNKSYEGKKGEDWDAINWPSYMTKAAKKIYKASQVEDETFIITGFDFSEKLANIHNDFQDGWQIILLIDSDMLNDKASWTGCLTNYHWIVYEGDLEFDTKKTKYTFSYYCWQEVKKKRTFKSNVFNTNFYGYIKFKK